LIEHWDGTAWSVSPSPNLGLSFNALYSVSALPASDVWAVGFATDGHAKERAMALHWDGSAWTSVRLPPHVRQLTSVDADSSDDVWATGMLRRYGAAVL